MSIGVYGQLLPTEEANRRIDEFKSDINIEHIPIMRHYKTKLNPNSLPDSENFFKIELVLSKFALWICIYIN
jgi:hypothetical protein